MFTGLTSVFTTWVSWRPRSTEQLTVELLADQDSEIVVVEVMKQSLFHIYNLKY